MAAAASAPPPPLATARDTRDWDRPAPAEVRAELDDLLADYRPEAHASLWERFVNWLNSWFSARDVGSRGGSPLWWFSVIAWIFVAWALLTLVAMLVLLGWTLYVLLRILVGTRTPAGARAPDRRSPLLRAAPATFDEALRLMRDCAARGLYREALAAMMLALVRWLEAAGAAEYHDSKTNGDYVVEFHGSDEGRLGLRTFTTALDRVMYSGAGCSASAFSHMERLFRQATAGVEQGT